LSLFPPNARDSLEFQFFLSTSLDIFTARLPHKTADHDFGLLQAIDEQLAMYGWLTNTGVKFVVIVDMEGRPAGTSIGKHNSNNSALLGLKDSELKPAFKALHTAYIRLLRNPFYDPDEHSPRSAQAAIRLGSMQIMSPKFIEEVARIGEAWYPGIAAI